MAKAATICLTAVLQYLVSPEQLCFQMDKYIGECTACAQLLAQRCRDNGLPGLAVLLDGDKAYDIYRVQCGNGSKTYCAPWVSRTASVIWSAYCTLTLRYELK